MAFHKPSVEYWPTSDDETDTEPAQSNFCFMADNEPTTRAPYVIDQVWSMISDLGLSKTPFESHMTKIENSLKADLRLYHDTIVKSDIYKSELQTLQLRFGESTRTRDKLERNIERKSEENNHILEQLNEALKQKRDLEIKNQSVISSEIKDTLEKEVLQLKQKVQDLTDKNTSLILKLDDSSKQIKFLESENQRFQGKLDSINIARKLSDDVFTKANNLGTGKIDTNYKPGIGRESFENEETEKKNGKISENSKSPQPDFFSSANEDDSDDETVINCSPDDTCFNISFKRVVKSESDSASSVTHQLRSTKLTRNDGTIKLENFLIGENSDHQNGSTSVPTVFPSLNSTFIGKNNLGKKYSKKQQTNKQPIQAVFKPKEHSRPIVFKEKPLKPSAVPQKQTFNPKQKPFQKPIQNRFQEININLSRNFQKPSFHQIPFNHQSVFQNHSDPRYKERLSNRSSHIGYFSQNQKSFQMTGFQKQISLWENLINQLKPQPFRPINKYYNDSKLSKTINKSGPTMVWVPKLSV
ncbi:hypothetical protein L2E82_03445 [Cichorium intybus]|uniref:Uncharacterized protein n=1 Tax=Cichorium intybus TaxID=13427 RepID=A0ACB9H624_CICIN|nr:hypothetical protein L2E82_03445 [Cichorium intybus]